MENLIVKVLVGEATQLEVQELEKWKAEAEENRTKVAEFKRILEVSAPENVDVEAAWLRFQKRRNAPFTRVFKRSLGIAAALVLFSGISWWLLGTKTSTYAVESGESVRVETLSDGSVVTLNKHSSLQYQGDFAENRQVNLKGEAFFQVAHDPSHPFVIAANDLEVTVLGTSFNVKSTALYTEVIVESGRVKVAQAGAEVVLEAGEAVRVDASSIRKRRIETDYHRHYRTGKLEFRETLLRELAEVLSDLYDVKIEVESVQVGERKISTVFAGESLEDMLKVIEETMGVNVEKQKEVYFIK
jgi:transmembrane sensor